MLLRAMPANNSAVHYHFGTKDGLIQAIFGHRLPQLTRERQMLAGRCDPSPSTGIYRHRHAIGS